MEVFLQGPDILMRMHALSPGIQLPGVLQFERPQSSASAPYNQPVRPAEVDYTSTRDPSPSSYSTLPYEHHDIGAKAKEKDTQARDDRRSSGFYSELEREGVRTRSRRSDKCLFSDSPSPISTLTLVEEVESDQSQFSVSQSGSFKAKPAASIS
ncbi:hypothetical protein E3U43_000248 [Larimichthys crocea]|uniref:Uncharacterized protein n=1 Tax=Larimichthys crocea TaxID=215358 RepID=A0ACD3Q8I3_LARCR|nr:hypothetical protein E3U43_000248 [Larimichthys crocea]